MTGLEVGSEVWRISAWLPRVPEGVPAIKVRAQMLPPLLACVRWLPFRMGVG